MKKFTFSADHDTTSASLGISDKRHSEIVNAAKDISRRAVFFDKTITKKSQAIEIYLNEIQLKNEVEFFWAGAVFTDVFSQTENLAKKMSKI